MLKTTLFSLVTLVLSGCATVQLAPDRVARQQASVRGAEELGALGVPAARLHLQFSKDQAALAQSMAADGDERASLVMARSEADAELALGLAREAQVHADALRAATELKAVKARGAP